MSFHKRQPQDYYATPYWCFEALAPYINWDKKPFLTFLEPCAGDGRILDWANINGCNSEHCELTEGTNYLTQPTRNVDLIITNPPYSKALEFLKKGITESRASAWLLRLNFLASQGRKEFFQEHSLSALYVLSKRPSFVHGGTDNSDYGWFIWDDKEIPIFNKYGIMHL